jgi:mRNA-degrading endonuclease RelE of RelBE toxin-antitoxin system
VDLFRPEEWPRFVRFPAFTRDWERLGLNDAALRALETEILKDPSKSPVIQGTGGLRKIRFSEPGSGRGRSGAYRVCYASFPEFGTVALVVIFGKAEKDNLTKADRNAIAKVITQYRAELEREFGRRQRPAGGRGRRGDHGQDD